MSWTLTTSGAILLKAGSWLPASVSGGALLKTASDLAESTFCGLTGKDWITTNAGTNYQLMISDAVSSLAAAMLITYDFKNAYSRVGLQTQLDFLTNNANTIIKHLQDDNNKKRVA